MKKKGIILIIAVIIIIIGIVILVNRPEVEENNDNNLIQDELINEKMPMPDIVTGENTSVSIDFLKNQNLPMILCFVSDSNEESKENVELLEEMQDEYDGKVIIQIIDYDLNPKMVSYYEIENLPEQVLIYNDETPYIHKTESDSIEYIRDEEGNIEYTKHSGNFTKEELISIIEDMDEYRIDSY